MQKDRPHYAITVEARLPEFEAERLFVINEKEFAHEELAKLKKKSSWLSFLPVEPKLKDWKHYIRELDHYSARMDRHEEEVADGLVPVKFFVVNMGDRGDAAIKVKVRVEHGTIHPAKTAPVRPARVDAGPEHVPDWKPAPMIKQAVVGGFARSGIKIDAHEVEAELSMLEAQDSADLVHQVLYVDGNKDTRFMYEIRSKHLVGVVRGEVEFG
jgi:hypothetical protein